MKKTMIALAVAASAVVSGSALAASSWAPGDFNGFFEMAGQLTPPTQTNNPWSVAVGNKVSNLDATLTAGQKDVTINVTSPISILGIRPTENKMFVGQGGITPQISYGDAVDLNSFVGGTGNLTLPVKSGEQTIGTLTAKIYAGGMYAWFKDYGSGITDGIGYPLYASAAGKAFFGGLGKTEAAVDRDGENVVAEAIKFFPDIADTYQSSEGNYGLLGEADFTDSEYELSGLYASGIQAGERINIELTDELSEATNWTASLPVTVTYM
ncbi:hypothetical protein [Escherichia coli]|uniref:F4 family fimbrial subunit n=1 Tax=Escherichia coli TaxID=562 RepID=UPI00158A4F06|nr:hypothetical protein [Escherichia coli]